MTRRRPNIVLTIADDQRASAVGCAGLEAVRTPHLDRLACRGTRYPNTHHLGSPHGAVCAPSRAMLMTGRPYFQLPDSLLSPDQTPSDPAVHLPASLPQQLREHGYHTFATGKWHNGRTLFHRSFCDGAKIFFGGMSDHWFTPVHDFDSEGIYAPSHRTSAGGFSTEVFARAAVDFIHSRKDDPKPFFCYCAFTAPHDPRTPPDAFRRMYDPSAMILPPNITADTPFDKNFLGVPQPADNGSLNVRDELLLGSPRDPAEIRRALAEYYGMISHMDEWIGNIHQAIEEIGAMENTLIIHTADHGLAVGQHGLMGKQNLYQHSVTVPLIVAGPGFERGRIDPSLCYQHDLHPTLREAAGLPSTDLTFFQSLHALSRPYVGSAHSATQRMVRNSRHKLLAVGNTEQLFDLENDPWETHDLSQDPVHQTIRTELRTALHDWQRETGDPHAA